MSEWWEEAPLAPADDPSFSGPILGPPKEPKPYEPPSGYSGGPERLTPIPGGPADKAATDPKAQESERTAAYLASNLSANINLMNQALKVDPSASKPTWKQWAAGLFGDTAENLASPEQRQVVNNSQKLITDAALTLGTGAAYTKEQLATYQRGFFPQVGDGEAAIKAKHEALRAALVAARLKAGSQAPQIDAAMQALGMDPSAPLTAKPEDALALATAKPNGGSGGGGDAQPGVVELNDEQKQAYAAFVASHRGKPPSDAIKTFLEGMLGKSLAPGRADEIAKALAEGRGYSTQVEDLTYRQKVDQRLNQEDKLGLGANPAETLTLQGATLGLNDEAAGVGNAAANIIAAPFTGKLDPVGAYSLGRDVERERVDQARDQLGWGGTALEVAGGLASASPTNALAAFSPRAATAAAATGGALAGFGSGEGAQDSLVRGGVGAAGGAAVQHVVPNAVERVLRMGGRGMAPDLARASEAEGVDLIRPMVDPEARSDYGALESNVYSQSTIRGGAARVRGQIEDRVENLGAGGTPLDTEAAGSVVQGSGRRFIERSRQVANTLYNRARSLAGDATVTPKAALGQLRQELQALNETPNVNQGEIDFINELGQDLTSGPLSVEAIRGLRASVRGRISASGLTASQADARATRVIDALQQDVQASLPPAAAQAYRRADLFYRERMVHIDDIVSRFLGKRDAPISGEQAFSRLKTMTNPGGDSRRLAGLMRSLTPDERNDIAATIAQSLGRRAPDEPFSTALFVSQARKLSPGARRTIFGQGGAESIENLSLLSQRLEEAGQDINRSRSATVLERQGIRNAARSFIAAIAGLGGQAATGSLAGGVAGAGVAVGAMGVSAARRVLSARAMVNPRVSRWLAQSVDASTPQQAQEAVRKFGLIISREPALANELKPIYDLLNQRVTPRLAADQPEGGNNE